MAASNHPINLTYKDRRGWPKASQLSPERMIKLAKLQAQPEIIELQGRYERALELTAAKKPRRLKNAAPRP